MVCQFDSFNIHINMSTQLPTITMTFQLAKTFPLKFSNISNIQRPLWLLIARFDPYRKMI
jgi:hypothetical protein